MNRRLAFAAIAALIGLSAGERAEAETFYAIGDGGLSLLRFSSDDPGSVNRVGFFGGFGSGLDAIDFRPATGQLYGYQDLTDSYFVVDLASAMLTPASAPEVGASTNTFFLGMDWNPTIDRLRVVTDSGQNLVYNPEDGMAVARTDLFYVPGDPNEPFAPLVIDNAYTNNLQSNFGGTTQQYVLDYGLDVLALLDNNTGRLTTVGEVTLGGSLIDFDEFVGFDIFTGADGSNIAYALFTLDGETSLYTIDLSTAEATRVGGLDGGFGTPYSLAAVPVPEPSTLALVGLGAVPAAVLAARRRHRHRRTPPRPSMLSAG
jgi:hypothetical protein